MDRSVSSQFMNQESGEVKIQPLKKITAYLNTDEYVRFRMKLLQLGISFSSWLRTKIKEELAVNN